jgi:hypothetical protein
MWSAYIEFSRGSGKPINIDGIRFLTICQPAHWGSAPETPDVVLIWDEMPWHAGRMF